MDCKGYLLDIDMLSTLASLSLRLFSTFPKESPAEHLFMKTCVLSSETLGNRSQIIILGTSCTAQLVKWSHYSATAQRGRERGLRKESKHAHIYSQGWRQSQRRWPTSSTSRENGCLWSFYSTLNEEGKSTYTFFDFVWNYQIKKKKSCLIIATVLSVCVSAFIHIS